MAHYLVTGGAGFIGSHLVEALVARGDRVRVLDDLSGANREWLASCRGTFELVEGDICDPAAVARAVEGVEVVFHEAALPSVQRSVEDPLATHAVCATGTLVLLDAARRAGVRRVVYAASSSAYGASTKLPKQETDLPEPTSPYGAAKLAGEHYCAVFWQVYGLETVRLRYFNIFGPRQDPASPYSAVIPLFVMAILRGERPVIYGDGKQSRDFTYISNVVQANLLAADAPDVSGKVYNVGCGYASSLLELVECLNRLMGTAVEPIHAPPRAGDVRHSLADISLARAELGYDPEVGFEEGLRRSIEYYREVGAASITKR